MTNKISALFLIFLFAVNVHLSAQDIPTRPNPPRLVNDFADILSPQQERNLEIKLRNFHDTTSNQITIVTVKSFNGYDPAMFAIEIGEKWKVGQKEFDNGIVVLVKPKYGQNDRGHVYIATGYGLEGAIPDATASQIRDNEMLPAFRNNDYYRGLSDATNVLMSLAAGEISAEGYNKQAGAPGYFRFIPFIAMFIIILIMRSARGREDGMGGGKRSSLPFWTALWLGSSMGRSHNGSWGGFSGGGSGSGSGFGGGSSFGGFGGGSFGGGGAGGSW